MSDRVETIFDDPNLALKAPRQDNMEGIPTLRPSWRENNPSLVVRTKVPNDANKGIIEAGLSNRAFYSIMQMVEDVAKNKGPIEILMDNKGHRWVNKIREKDPSVMTRVNVSKGEDGVVSITISAGNKRPLIPFQFIDDTYHQLRGSDGQPLQTAVASRIYALAWVDMMRRYMALVLEKNYKQPEWMKNRQNQQQQGNGGGGGNNNNYQQRPQQQQSQPQQTGQSSDFNFDDDVPL